MEEGELVSKMTEPSSKKDEAAGARPNGKKRLLDTDFNPPIEMMIHDYDDEQTLEEEEAMGSLEDPQVELSSLEREGNMPLEDLMAMYGYNDPDNMTTCSEELSGGDKSTETDTTEKKSEPSELEQLYQDPEEMEAEPSSSRPSRYSSQPSEDEVSDADYMPEEEGRRKTIMVGSDYQAGIPEGLCKYDDALPYENEDKLVWDPSNLSSEEIEDYLKKVQEPQGSGVGAIPMGNHTRDDEQALYVLLQCGHNIDEALRRRKVAMANSEPISLWSEEECRLFETGVRVFGKDFRQIQNQKVRTRTVGELVQFYYLWKKTERHDIFANKARLEKKKYFLHPGITDYMDRFLDESEKDSSRDRSTSPSVQRLIYTDPKWQRNSNGTLDEKDDKPEVGEVKTEVKVEDPSTSRSEK